MVRSAGELALEVGEWECMECGYIEEGTRGQRPKKCPECDAPASALEFFPDEDDLPFDRSVGEDYAEDDDEEYEEEETGLHEGEYDEEEI